MSSISDSGTGSGAEGAGIGITNADTGAGVDAQLAPSATLTDTDTGAGVDGGEGITANPSDADTGIGAEGWSVSESSVSPVTGNGEYGGFPYGFFPYGGGSLAEALPPSVVVTGPAGTLTSGGPDVTVTWEYSQPQGRPQTGALIQILDTANSDAIVYQQSIDGTDQSLTFNAIGAGLDPNSTGSRYLAQVTVYAGDPHLDATGSVAFDLAWGQPTVVITQPVAGGPLFAPSTPVQWTYTDSDGNPQATYSLALVDSVGRTVANGGTTVSPGTSAMMFFFPIDQADYTLSVTVTNTNGVPGTATVLVVGDNPAATGTPGAPTLSPATMRWYRRLPAYMRDADAAQQNPALPLLAYMACLGEQQGAVEALYDRLDWVPPNEGGPAPDSGLVHSRSDLVSPFSADDAWLPWLANILGVPRYDRSLAQWRVAMIPRPDPGGAQRYVKDPVTGAITKQPLMLSPFGAGSKGGIKQAIQDIYAQAVTPATLIQGSPVLNAGYAQQPQIAPLLGAAWTSPDSSALVVSTANGFQFTAENGVQMTVTDTQTDSGTVTAFAAGAEYTFQMRLASPNVHEATLKLTMVGTSVTNTAHSTLADSPDGTLLSVALVAPAGVTSVTVELDVTPGQSGALDGEVFTATGIATLAPIFTDAQRGGNVYGLGLPADTTIVAVLGPVSVELSNPAEYTVPAGLVVVVPRVAVFITDHWLGDPWHVNVAVPVGTDPDAIADTLDAQQPAGVIFDVTFGVLTWQGLYDTYGDGTSATWIGIEGSTSSPRTWDDLERELT